MTGIDWREQRKSGLAAIGISLVIGFGLWVAMIRAIAPLAGMDDLSARMLVALKCVAMAALFCLFTGTEAVAHERLQSPAFDPLAGHETRRLRVNKQYLQNTLEQFVIFAVGLFGLAAYSADGAAMRLVVATTVVWVLFRFAFWIGYHKSAAMRAAGAPGLLVGQLLLLYVAVRVGGDVAGDAGAWATLIVYLAFEALLFWHTRGMTEEARA